MVLDYRGMRIGAIALGPVSAVNAYRVSVQTSDRSVPKLSPLVITEEPSPCRFFLSEDLDLDGLW